MNHKIFVLGELNVDLIISGEDLTPEMNREKLVEDFDLVLGSSSAITACCLSGLGNEVLFVGVVGDDQFGHFCIEQLKQKGVDTSYVTVDPTLKTGVTLSLSTKMDRALLTYMGAIPKLTIKQIPESMFLEADHIHFGSYYLQEEMREQWNKLFIKAKQHKISTSFDTGWDPQNRWYTNDVLDLLQYTDLFIPSEDELYHILNIHDVNNLKNYIPPNHGYIAVKQGDKGSTLFNRENRFITAQAYEVFPRDLTGAGDSFNAGLITGYLLGMGEEDLLKFANACGAIATQRYGGASQVPSFEEVKEFQLERFSKK
jgi:sugar/nucleoside kinase (ribokinase family)